LEKSRKLIESEVASLVYYMNGGLGFVDAYNLSIEQMNVLTETISKHYERQNEAMTGRGNKIR
jgi:hypothetical protein